MASKATHLIKVLNRRSFPRVKKRSLAAIFPTPLSVVADVY
jgi:hypothetical protein